MCAAWRWADASFRSHNFLFALIITHNGGNPDGRLRCSPSHFLVVSKLLVKCGQDGIWDFGIRVLFNPDSLRTQKLTSVSSPILNCLISLLTRISAISVGSSNML